MGHKKFECRKPRKIQEVEGGSEGRQQGDTMELGRIWNLGMVAVSDSPFAQLGRMKDEEEEEGERRSELVDSESRHRQRRLV